MIDVENESVLARIRRNEENGLEFRIDPEICLILEGDPCLNFEKWFAYKNYTNVSPTSVSLS